MRISYAEAVRAYLLHCETEKQNGACWLRFQRGTLFKFMVFVHDHSMRSLASIQPYHLTDFLAERAQTGESPASRARRGVIIRAVARWCEKEGRVGPCPLSRAAVKSVKSRPPELPTREHLLLLIASVKKPILRDAFELLLLTGLRRGELLALRWADLNVNEEVGYVRATQEWKPKSGRGRAFPLTPRACEILKARQVGPKTPGPFLTWTGTILNETTFTKGFKRLVKMAGLARLRLHDLRHAFGTYAVNDFDIDIREVQEVMGHASIATTGIYVHARKTAARHCAEKMSKSAG